MRDRLRVGTRRSPLARRQTDLVLAALARAAPEVRFEVVARSTSGDRDLSPGANTDFTDALDRALRRGEIDLAVHSAKDLAAELPRGLDLAACPPRADPRDCLVVAPALRGRALPTAARVGSSSPRRKAQLLRWRPDLNVVELRGNVDTRLALVAARRVDAAILAVSGLGRLERTDAIDRTLRTDRFLPAPGQGALALVTRSGDRAAGDLARRIDHAATRHCVAAERELSAALGGDCRQPLGALATLRGEALTLTGELLTPDGAHRLRRRIRGPATRGPSLGRSLGRAMRRAVRGTALEIPSRGP